MVPQTAKSTKSDIGDVRGPASSASTGSRRRANASSEGSDVYPVRHGPGVRLACSSAVSGRAFQELVDRMFVARAEGGQTINQRLMFRSSTTACRHQWRIRLDIVIRPGVEPASLSSGLEDRELGWRGNNHVGPLFGRRRRESGTRSVRSNETGFVVAPIGLALTSLAQVDREWALGQMTRGVGRNFTYGSSAAMHR